MSKRRGSRRFNEAPEVHGGNALALEMAGHARQHATPPEQVGDEREGFRGPSGSTRTPRPRTGGSGPGHAVPSFGGLVLDAYGHAMQVHYTGTCHRSVTRTA